MPAGVAAASPMVAGARTPTVALDSAAAAGRFHSKQTSKTETSSNPYFLFTCLPVLVICTICTHSTCARIKWPGACHRHIWLMVYVVVRLVTNQMITVRRPALPTIDNWLIKVSVFIMVSITNSKSEPSILLVMETTHLNRTDLRLSHYLSLCYIFLCRKITYYFYQSQWLVKSC